MIYYALRMLLTVRLKAICILIKHIFILKLRAPLKPGISLTPAFHFAIIILNLLTQNNPLLIFLPFAAPILFLFCSILATSLSGS